MERALGKFFALQCDLAKVTRTGVIDLGFIDWFYCKKGLVEVGDWDARSFHLE